MERIKPEPMNISVTRIMHYDVRKALAGEQLVVYLGLDIDANLLPEGDLVGVPSELVIILLERHQRYVERAKGDG